MARPSGYLRTSAFCFDCHSAIKLISEIFSRDYFGISGNLSCAIKIGYYREVTGWLCTNPGDEPGKMRTVINIHDESVNSLSDFCYP
ncbi:hypothetical protein HPP92_020452 [Vanilla planifolia]|uniref:Uncharacterized protein n=1 Tax=Vanilla planifolia TaxID=51239 RepID=A0A835PWX5_VANPL|nr:hypothetical protein HPP92_020452 [Vanilla planifolia]